MASRRVFLRAKCQGMTEIAIRRAQSSDLPSIVALLADDHLGRSREDASSPLNGKYVDAFEALQRATATRGWDGGSSTGRSPNAESAAAGWCNSPPTSLVWMRSGSTSHWAFGAATKA